MEYMLVVTKMEKNPKWQQCRPQYSREPEEPEFLTNHQVLNVCLSETEFTAVKKAVIEVIK